jgi:predicted nuclease with TOPRIM domain
LQSSLCDMDENADTAVKDASTRLNELKEIQSKQSAVLESIQGIGTKRALLNEAIKRAEQQDGACGCPIGEIGEQCYCELPSTSCFEHMHWAALQRSTLVQEELLQDNLLKRLKTEENLLRLKLASSS